MNAATIENIMSALFSKYPDGKLRVLKFSRVLIIAVVWQVTFFQENVCLKYVYANVLNDIIFVIICSS